MRRSNVGTWSISLVVNLIVIGVVHAQQAVAPAPAAPDVAQAPAAGQTPKVPGDDGHGVLLPNGWRLMPVGRHTTLADLPLNIIPLSDNRRALVATNGYNSHQLTLVDLASGEKLSQVEARETWFGLALDAQSGNLWWSGGGAGSYHRFRLNDQRLEPVGGPGTQQLVADAKADAPVAIAQGFTSGLYLDAPAKTIYTLTIFRKGGNKSFAWGDANKTDEGGSVLSAVSLDGRVLRSAPCGSRAYDVVRARNGLLYVSDWADRRVLVVDAESLRTIAKIPVGDHPNQLALHPTDNRLFVACASSNQVSVIDTSTGVVQEVISTALFPKSPEGCTPDALCVSPDGETLYVANADNNCIAVVDIEKPRRSAVAGFIPTGWYPTSVAATPDGKRLLVGVGKGTHTASNKPSAEKMAELKERGPDGYRKVPFPHIGTTLNGALSVIELPDDDDDLQKLTDRVYQNCPYSDKLIAGTPYQRKTAIPTKVGAPSPIKHVIYIIKENRTYDQVFGDMPRGNGDESLLMFGRQVTPNHHKLAEEFVLLDNLYCNGHVSADGHPWSTMAYNTDYIARNWCLTYSKRTGIDDDDDGDLTNAPSGYIWDACGRHGKTYRSYGEYGGRVSQPDGTFRIEGRVPGLIGHTCPTYGLPKAKGQKVRDTDRVATFLEEFHEYEKNGNLPNFIVMSLGEDHTEGTKVGAPTPQACVASNDLALGRLVEAVSNSKYWPQIAIFVIEDDAQNGPDHVDAHRTLGLVISPYVRRGHLDSTQYATVSMLRTMELILGLPPLSQFDAAATPMFESFDATPDLKPYEHLPAQIDLSVVNTVASYGAKRSELMDFTEYDRVDDFELNEILWRAVKGVDAPLPPAVRQAIAYRGELRE
ncbi:MAG: beta-propeller fold lactonase family protein [Planctomycetes bacterium]|nr:beta-propeller fold lactonase family protein [Planctomycetota bacterium]